MKGMNLLLLLSCWMVRYEEALRHDQSVEGIWTAEIGWTTLQVSFFPIPLA
jgi:hypothetical protein